MANDVHKLCGPLLLSRSPDIVEKYIFVYWCQIERKKQVKGTFINFNWKFGKRKFDTLLNLITCLHIILSLSYRRRCCASFGVHSNIQKFIEFPSNSPTLPTFPLPHITILSSNLPPVSSSIQLIDTPQFVLGYAIPFSARSFLSARGSDINWHHQQLK